MKEILLQSWCVAFASARGVVGIRLHGSQNSGQPDYVFLFDDGVSVFVEFKREGKALEKLQAWWREQILRVKHRHYKIDTQEDFKHLFVRYPYPAQRAKT
jgi:hypothetical protein